MFINDKITENTNLLEIYIINNNSNNNKIELNKNVENILNKYKFKSLKYKTYYKNNLMYTYDLVNDSQYVNEKKLENIFLINNTAILSYNDLKYPTYIFPCTNDIDYEIEYILYEYKLNNRISLIIRKENNNYILYIQYKHSNVVDIDKMESIINNLLKEIIT